VEKQHRYNIKLTAREIGQLEGAMQFLIETNLSTQYLKTSFENLLKNISGQFEAEQHALKIKYGIEEASGNGPSS